MRRVLRWLGILLGLVLVCLMLAAVGIYVASERAMEKTYAVEAETITVPTDEEAVARGEYLVTAVGACWHCHGENLGGGTVIDDSMIAVIDAPNLTTGEGGIEPEFTDQDFVRAIRHGVAPDGRGLLIMPSNDYFNFSDSDLAAVIAYLRSLPPVDNETRAISPGPVGRLIMVSGDALVPAASIDHDAETPAQVEPAVSADYGEYLASIACMGCHGENLGGTESPQPGGINPPNLTPGGIMEGYDLEKFSHFLHTGETFAGREVDDDNMPWTAFQHLNDEDMEAIYLYITSVAPVE